MLRAEARDFVGSNLETSDSEGFVPGGCKRVISKPFSKSKCLPGRPKQSKL